MMMTKPTMIMRITTNIRKNTDCWVTGMTPLIQGRCLSMSFFGSAVEAGFRAGLSFGFHGFKQDYKTQLDPVHISSLPG